MSELKKSILEIVQDAQLNEDTVDRTVKCSMEQIEATNKTINAYITIADAQTLSDEISESKNHKEGLLYGVPIAIKDNIVTKNMRLTCASKMLENFDKPLYESTVTQKLIEAGSINMGKLNMDEFAMGASNETSFFGPVRNPYNTDYVSGGSSGGTAVAVAAGTVKAALGTDTGGSVRQPAAFTNTVGLKPTYGRVSRFGVTAFASSLDQVGIITKTVADNAQVLSVIAGHDEFDATSAKVDVPMYHENLNLDLTNKRIAVIEEFLSDAVHEDVRNAVKDAIELYKQLGAIVEIVSVPHIKYVVPAYYIIAPSEASSNLSRFDGLDYGYRSDKATDVESMYRLNRAEGFGDEVKKRLVLGTYFLNHDAYDAYYIQAAKLRTLIKQDFDNIFKEYDVILGPTTPTPPFKIGAQIDDAMQMYLNDLCTIPANLIGIPALSIPGGFTQEGLPIGIQLSGPAFSEQLLYQFAYQFEQKTNYYQIEPKDLEVNNA